MAETEQKQTRVRTSNADKLDIVNYHFDDPNITLVDIATTNTLAQKYKKATQYSVLLKAVAANLDAKRVCFILIVVVACFVLY